MNVTCHFCKRETVSRIVADFEEQGWQRLDDDVYMGPECIAAEASSHANDSLNPLDYLKDGDPPPWLEAGISFEQWLREEGQDLMGRHWGANY